MCVALPPAFDFILSFYDDAALLSKHSCCFQDPASVEPHNAFMTGILVLVALIDAIFDGGPSMHVRGVEYQSIYACRFVG